MVWDCLPKRVFSTSSATEVLAFVSIRASSVPRALALRWTLTSRSGSPLRLRFISSDGGTRSLCLSGLFGAGFFLNCIGSYVRRL